jgi:hypothetical protein
MGNSHEPVTLHKYLYGNADPIRYVDPTGNFSMGEMSAAMNTMGRLANMSKTNLAAGRSYIGRAITASAHASVAGIRLKVKQCRITPKKCKIPNLVVIGSDNPESQKHILDAQSGYGSNGAHISPLVTYIKGANKSRSWIRRTPECKGKTGRAIAIDCDEYPFAASKEGGKARYKSYKVSLRPIGASDNRRAGAIYGAAVRKAKNGDKFVIAPVGPVSFYVTNFGK